MESPSLESSALVRASAQKLNEAFTAATCIYIAINIVVTFAMRRTERRVAVPGYIGMAPPATAE